MRWKHRVIIPVGLVVFVFVTHLFGLTTSYDSRWSIPTARSLLYERNTDLNEYQSLLEKNQFFAIEVFDGRFYSTFPIGASLLAVPVVGVVDALGLNLRDGKIEKAVASLAIALTTMLLFLIARRSLDVREALLVALVFAFCTAAWSTASRALWQHGPSMLMLTLALWLIVVAQERPWVVQFVSLPLAFSYVVRPTNVVSIVFLSALVLLRHRQFFLRYMLWGLAVLVPFAAYSAAVYHWPVPPYYSVRRVGHVSTFFEALAGNLVSPARGVFVHSPVLLLCVYGAWRRLRERTEWLDWTLVAIVIAHWVVISSFPHWWGGHSFGYRFFSDMLPYMMYFLVPVIARIPALPLKRRRVFLWVLGGLTAVSLFINYRGANDFDVYLWNRQPVDVDLHPARLWDWNDPQFLRGLVHPEHGRRPRLNERS